MIKRYSCEYCQSNPHLNGCPMLDPEDTEAARCTICDEEDSVDKATGICAACRDDHIYELRLEAIAEYEDERR